MEYLIMERKWVMGTIYFQMETYFMDFLKMILSKDLGQSFTKIIQSFLLIEETLLKMK